MAGKNSVFVDGSSPSVDDVWLNIHQNEVKNIIESSGQILSDVTTDQVSKAVATYSAVSDFYTDGGTANSYVLSPQSGFKAPIAYKNGMKVRYRAANNNTGASVVNIAGIGPKSIKLPDGVTDIGAGAITTNADVEIRYDLTNDCFVLTSVAESVATYPSSSKTIVSGAINVADSSNIIVDTEGAASTDDLTTLNGGVIGQALFLTSANSARNVVIKNATGNIILANQADFTLDVASVDNIILKYDGTNWREIARSNMVPGLSLLTGDATTSNNSGYAKVGVIDVGGVKKDLIWQWGNSANVGQDSSVNVIFPIAFTTVFCINATHMAATSIGSGTWGVPTRSPTGFTFFNGGDAFGTVGWQAIGLI